MRPKQITFSKHPGTYVLSAFQCKDVECSCTEVQFVLRKVTDGEVGNESTEEIMIRVDAISWREVEPPDRSQPLADLVSEFLRDYPESERDAMRAWHTERKRIAERLQEYRIDTTSVAPGKLISFRDILGPPNDSSWSCPLGEYYFDWGDDYYEAVERYCSNPACPCEVAHLSFFRVEPDPKSEKRLVATEQFIARLSLDGHVALDDDCKISRSEAEEILEFWEEEFGGDLDGLAWRYEKIKEIARRSAAAHRGGHLQMDALQEPDIPVRVGRNQPCPCGSGKKYKKCCGRNSDTIINTLF